MATFPLIISFKMSMVRLVSYKNFEIEIMENLYGSEVDLSIF